MFDLPHSEVAEKNIIASCMLDKKAMYKCAELKPEYFYGNIPGEIFRVMQVHNDNSTATICDKLGSSYPEIHDWIAELFDGYYSVADLTKPIEILKKHYSRRKIIEHCQTAINSLIAGEDPEELTDKLHMELYSAVDNSRSNDPQHIKSILPKVFEHLHSYSNPDGSGVKTGLVELDKTLCGMQGGELLILAGRPAMGKSSLADSIMRYAAVRANGTIGMFSVEMSSVMCGSRALCAEAGVSYHQIKTGTLPKRDLPKLSMAASPLSEAEIYVDDTPSINIPQLINKCNYIKGVSKNKKIDLIMIDYLQLMEASGNTKGRQQDISDISRNLKKIAKYFNCPVVALSQLSREVEKRDPPIPQLSDLRESGAIEQDADVVMFCYRPEYYDKENESLRGIAHVIIGKQRNGPNCTVELFFDANTMSFKNLEKNISEQWPE